MTSLEFDSLHIDHLAPIESTTKNHKHILAGKYFFTKFDRLYPTNYIYHHEGSHLEIQKKNFG